MGKNRCGIDKRQLSTGAESVITYASVWVSQSQTKLRHNFLLYNILVMWPLKYHPVRSDLCFCFFSLIYKFLKGDRNRKWGGLQFNSLHGSFQEYLLSLENITVRIRTFMHTLMWKSIFHIVHWWETDENSVYYNWI